VELVLDVSSGGSRPSGRPVLALRGISPRPASTGPQNRRPSRTRARPKSNPTSPRGVAGVAGWRLRLADELGIVEAVADRTHRRTHTSLPATLAKGDRRVLRPLVGMVDHLGRLARPQRHIEKARSGETEGGGAEHSTEVA
jgi:hypothetical protein